MREFRFILALLTLAAWPHDAGAAPFAVRNGEALSIGYRVWENESGGSAAGLTAWNRGEGFASLGIGHFIWYPTGAQGPFVESFPRLLEHLEANGVALPDWLRGGPDCPWPDRSAFHADMDDPRMAELRNLLTRTIDLQARFMADRLESALPRLLESAPASRRETVARRFHALASQPQGLYALIDYVNFKGEGLSATERYRGRGWGLLQVLLRMREESDGPTALAEFSAAARRVLNLRVRNSPLERAESRWLANWRRRVRTYRAA